MHSVSNQSAAYYAQDDLGYNLQFGLDPASFEDPKLRELWAAGKAALDAIDLYLKPWMDTDED